MTQIEKQIVKMIEDKFGFPYMTYDKQEQTWTNDNFLFDIKTETLYTSDVVRMELSKKYGTKFIENNYSNLLTKWFKMNNKYDVKHVVQYLLYMDNKSIKKSLEKLSNTIAKPKGVDYVYIKQIKSPSEYDYISYIFVIPDDSELFKDKKNLIKLMRRWVDNILKYYNLYIGETLNVIQYSSIKKSDFEKLNNDKIK